MRQLNIVINKRNITMCAAVIVVVVGVIAFKLHASGFFVASETETGTVSGNASIVSDTTASGGKAIQFNAPADTGGGGGTGGGTGGTTSRPEPFPAGMKPDATNTGVVPGTTLTVVSGNQTYGASSNGQTINGKDFHGFVSVSGANITFTNCIFRGGTPNGNAALFDTSDSTGPIVVRDSEFVPSTPAATSDGIWTKNTTLWRVNVHGTVDGIKADSASVIRNSYIHDMQWFANDPNQGGEATHNDAIQILNGSGITVDGNNLATAGQDPNSAIQITQDFGATSKVAITNNWADYGGCTFNITGKPIGAVSIGPVTGNRFGHHQGFSNCVILIGTKTTLTQNSGNVWDDTGAAIPAPQQHD